MADPMVVWSIGRDGVVTFTIGDQRIVFTGADGLAAFADSVEQARRGRALFDESGYDAARRFVDGLFELEPVPEGDLASVLRRTGEGIQVVSVADLEREPSLEARYRAIVDRLYDTRLQNHLEVLHELRDSRGSEESWRRVYEAAERERVVIERD